MPSNYDHVLRRQRSTMKGTMMQDPKIYDKYDKVLRDWEKQNMINQVQDFNPRRNGTYYHPHFGVLKMERETSKCRSVFDSAFKCDGASAKDHFLKGPVLNNDIADVIMRFRRFDHAMMADVSQMFLQVELKPEDQPYGRFLWFREEKMIIYEYTCHWFGKTDSPYVAMGGVAEAAERRKDKMPEAISTIRTASIVDDMVYSRREEGTLVQLMNEFREFFLTLKMKIRKYISNKITTMKAIPEEDRAEMYASDALLEQCFKGGNAPKSKVMGLEWDTAQEKIAAPIPDRMEAPSKGWCKRTVLGAVNSLYDPEAGPLVV
jgi:hypothetical protein